MEEIVGIASGVLTSISMIPQVVKLIKEKKCENVSISMIIVLIIGVMGWTFYGILKEDLIITLTNGFSVLLNIANLVLSIKYKQTPADESNQ